MNQFKKATRKGWSYFMRFRDPLKNLQAKHEVILNAFILLIGQTWNDGLQVKLCLIFVRSVRMMFITSAVLTTLAVVSKVRVDPLRGKHNYFYCTSCIKNCRQSGRAKNAEIHAYTDFKNVYQHVLD